MWLAKAPPPPVPRPTPPALCYPGDRPMRSVLQYQQHRVVFGSVSREPIGADYVSPGLVSAYLFLLLRVVGASAITSTMTMSFIQGPPRLGTVIYPASLITRMMSASILVSTPRQKKSKYQHLQGEVVLVAVFVWPRGRPAPHRGRPSNWSPLHELLDVPPAPRRTHLYQGPSKASRTSDSSEVDET